MLVSAREGRRRMGVGKIGEGWAPLYWDGCGRDRGAAAPRFSGGKGVPATGPRPSAAPGPVSTLHPADSPAAAPHTPVSSERRAWCELQAAAEVKRRASLAAVRCPPVRAPLPKLTDILVPAACPAPPAQILRRHTLTADPGRAASLDAPAATVSAAAAVPPAPPDYGDPAAAGAADTPPPARPSHGPYRGVPSSRGGRASREAPATAEPVVIRPPAAMRGQKAAALAPAGVAVLAARHVFGCKDLQDTAPDAKGGALPPRPRRPLDLVAALEELDAHAARISLLGEVGGADGTPPPRRLWTTEAPCAPPSTPATAPSPPRLRPRLVAAPFAGRLLDGRGANAPVPVSATSARPPEPPPAPAAGTPAPRAASHPRGGSPSSLAACPPSRPRTRQCRALLFPPALGRAPGRPWHLLWQRRRPPHCLPPRRHWRRSRQLRSPPRRRCRRCRKERGSRPLPRRRPRSLWLASRRPHGPTTPFALSVTLSDARGGRPPAVTGPVAARPPAEGVAALQGEALQIRGGVGAAAGSAGARARAAALLWPPDTETADTLAPRAQGDTQAISHAARAAAVLGEDFAMARADRDAWVRRRLRGSLAAGLRGRRGPDVAHQASSPAAQLQALSFLRGNRLSAAASPLLATPLAPQTDAMAAGPCRVGVAAASVSRCAEAPAAGRCSVGAPAAAVAGSTAAAAATPWRGRASV
ncbi:hypothetical protein BU14_0027s0052 [Porphyra umbilicalis]|uniref:Uncharacterized protein n=1 Tax=Porphyra umbilicalis TaxID=2786 RepID=A0A1X6PJT1_PORUM|nr:hypothetical protein BU14_0027s0052 [Porphyra umbilicalis]|eukprot:OSX81026.1 hypothetical protein BU14_0027s0052 [Porphyra umbilicalis]